MFTPEMPQCLLAISIVLGIFFSKTFLDVLPRMKMQEELRPENNEVVDSKDIS